MSRFSFEALSIAGAWTVHRKPIRDGRGLFERMYSLEDMAAVGWEAGPTHVNRSVTEQTGTVRGLHYQIPPRAERKLVSCLRGRVYDVLLDVRKGSPTFLQWCAVELNGDADVAVSIPPGVAHGFQSLSTGVEMLYFHSEIHSPEHERAVHVLDRRIREPIPFPLPISSMSARDQNHPALDDSFVGITV